MRAPARPVATLQLQVTSGNSVRVPRRCILEPHSPHHGASPSSSEAPATCSANALELQAAPPAPTDRSPTSCFNSEALPATLRRTYATARRSCGAIKLSAPSIGYTIIVAEAVAARKELVPTPTIVVALRTHAAT